MNQCQCPLEDDRCPIHELYLNKEQHRQCREVPGMFEAFQQLRGIAKKMPSLPRRPPVAKREKELSGPHDGKNCVYRGELTGETRCGCGNGTKTTPVYSCEKHGSCSDKQATVASIHFCKWCDDFTARSVPQPEQ
jgi:hypothetical protein